MPDRLTPSSARLSVNPILSETARGYRHPDHVWRALFPAVPVSYRGGTRVEFNKASFIPRDTRRAPGADAKQVRFGYDGTAFSLEDHSLDAKIPIEDIEESRAVPSMNHAQRVSRSSMQLLSLGLEQQAATLATTGANYSGNTAALSGNDQWSDYSNSNPAAMVETWKETIRGGIAQYPNTMVIGASVASMLRNHPSVIASIPDNRRGVANDEDIRAYFNIDNLVIGKSVTASTSSGSFTDLWGKIAILAYVARGSVSREEPSFGYTYELSGHPVVYARQWNASSRSWVYPHDYVRAPLIVGAEAGYLGTAVIA